MNACKTKHCAFGGLLWMVLAAGLPSVWGAAADLEAKFDALQVGTQTYSNVTVTTKAKNYVFILHDSGMTSLRVAELSPDLREKLGYSIPKPATNTATAWAKREIAKINVPQVKDLGRQLEQKWREKPATNVSVMGLAGPTLMYAVLGVAVLIWLFYCYCLLLICRKTGNPGGLLVWLPALQIFPMLRAAAMSYWWVLAYFVPVLNIVPPILWCFNIAKARGKSVWVGIFLLLPITSLFAFLYLAFSDGGSAEEDDDADSKVMTLQTV